MSVVICKLPRAGLGNQLFPLVKAAVFAELNELPLIVSGYNQFRIGPYLRGEKTKRNYRGVFSFRKKGLAALSDQFSLFRYRHYREIMEPAIGRLPAEPSSNRKFIFSAIPHWSDYFAGLKENRDLAISFFRGMLQKNILLQTELLPAPFIGLHVRMGDFRKLKEGEDFRSAGAIRTPERYFMEIISSIREIHGSPLPVALFTDGFREEFKELFSLENVYMVEGNADIVDMLLLAKSRLIVASAGSTFSYWAGFLSDAPLILHPDHLHAPIRPVETNAIAYEGPLIFGEVASLLKKNIRDIHYE
jgi:hypothetical protein